MSTIHKIEMTAAERFWYVLGCIALGAAHFIKIPVSKALSELPRYRAARSSAHDQLVARGESVARELTGQ
jgi:hypothetical protein